MQTAGGFTVEAASDAGAIERAKAAAMAAMGSGDPPEHIEAERGGVTITIARATPAAHQPIIEDIAFDDGRIHPRGAT